MFNFQVFKALDLTCSLLHNPIQNSCNKPVIFSGHFLKSICKGNLYLGHLHIIDQILESVIISKFQVML